MTGPRFLPKALAEYEDAVVYYETEHAGLGARVVQEFDEAVSLLRSFPLKVVYTARSDELIVTAVFHTSRRPGYWKRRLKQLG